MSKMFQRNLLESKDYNSIADNKYKSPTVIVSQCKDNMVEHFKQKGIQVTGFVPFMLNEPKYTHTFRIGLFGLDKLKDPRKTIEDFGNQIMLCNCRVVKQSYKNMLSCV